MSVRASTWVWDQDLPPNAKMVALALADHADDVGGHTFPSIALLSRKTGYSPRQVQRILSELLRLEVIDIQAEATSRRPTMYRLLMARPLSIRRAEFSPSGATPELRAEVIEAFHRECYWCQRPGRREDDTDPDGAPWEVDRLRKGRHGGSYEPENVVLSCRKCNRKRSGAGRQDDAPRVGATGATGRGDTSDAPGTTEVSSEPSVEPSDGTSLLPGGSDDVYFEKFWLLYPARNGRKVGKKAARDKWVRLSSASRAGLMVAVANYAAAVLAGDTIAKDPERFLKSDFWRDWLEGPPLPTAPTDGGASRVVERKHTECATCEDTHWIDDPDKPGAVVRCPDCSS